MYAFDLNAFVLRTLTFSCIIAGGRLTHGDWILLFLLWHLVTPPLFV